MITLSLELKNARAQQIVDAVDTNGTITLYSSPRGDTSSVIVELGLGTPLGVVTGGVLVFNPISKVNATQNATVVWASLHKQNGDVVMEVDCGIVASSAELKFGDINLLDGVPVKIASFIINEGG